MRRRHSPAGVCPCSPSSTKHPDWFRPLFAELDRRGVPYARIDAAHHTYDPTEQEAPLVVVFNRASPSAYLRDARQTTFHTLHWLRHLERLGVDVVNGAHAYAVELSKAWQLDLLTELGVAFPRSRVDQPPVAGRGAAAEGCAGRAREGQRRRQRRGDRALRRRGRAARGGRRRRADLGVDGTALVQELAPLRGGRITRVETLGGRFLYAIHVYPADTGFNLCPADACVTGDGRRARARPPARSTRPRTGCAWSTPPTCRPRSSPPPRRSPAARGSTWAASSGWSTAATGAGTRTT
jgi:hypothetical protein